MKIAGKCKLTIDGATYTVGATASYDPATFEREDVETLSDEGAYKEKSLNPNIELDLLTTDVFKYGVFEGMTEVTVQFEADAGGGVILNKAWCTKAQKIDAAEGTAPVVFKCGPKNISPLRK